jgi:hemoglobin
MEGAPRTSLLAEMGGVEKLRAVLRDFYDRVFADAMIGFMFRGVDKERLVEKELELTARAFGARDVAYTGRPLREVHARHRIMGGQFARRLQILRETMADHGLPESVRKAWIEHTEALRPLVTGDMGSACDPDLARRRAEAYEAESRIAVTGPRSSR